MIINLTAMLTGLEKMWCSRGYVMIICVHTTLTDLWREWRSKGLYYDYLRAHNAYWPTESDVLGVIL